MGATDRITSRRHPIVRRCRAAAAREAPDATVLLDGEHLLAEALAAGADVEVVLADREDRDVVRRAVAARVPVFLATGDVLAAASPVRTPSGVVALARWTPAPLAPVFAGVRPLVVGLAGVQDPGNVGSAIRSADALGATGFVLLDGSADPAHWRVLRGAMGSSFRIPVARASGLEALAAARAAGLAVAAMTAQGGTPLSQADLRRPILLLFGNEGSGLDPRMLEASDVSITIPMQPGVSSLNVAVSAALAVAEAARQRGQPVGVRP